MFNNLVNFRDLGGIPTQNGKKIKEKRILRSGELVNLTKEEQDVLINEYNLKTIVDFRSQREVNIKPDDKLKSVRYCHIDLYKNKSDEMSFEEWIMQIKSIDHMHEMLKDIYRLLIEDTESIKGFRKYIDEYLRLETGSLIFHCYAGKDRTGIASAIILTLLGANEEDIYKDYLLTNKFRAQKNEEMAIQLKDIKTPEEIQIIKKVLSVDKSYLEHAIKIAENRYGTFLNYIKKTMNVTDEEIKRLRKMYTH